MSVRFCASREVPRGSRPGRGQVPRLRLLQTSSNPNGTASITHAPGPPPSARPGCGAALASARQEAAAPRPAHLVPHRALVQDAVQVGGGVDALAVDGQDDVAQDQAAVPEGGASLLTAASEARPDARAACITPARAAARLAWTPGLAAPASPPPHAARAHHPTSRPASAAPPPRPAHRPYSSREEPLIPALAAGPPSRAFSTSTPFTPSCCTAGGRDGGAAGARGRGAAPGFAGGRAGGAGARRQGLPAGGPAGRGRRGRAARLRCGPAQRQARQRRAGGVLECAAGARRAGLPAMQPAAAGCSWAWRPGSPAAGVGGLTGLVGGKGDAHDGAHHLAVLDDLPAWERRS